MVVLKPSSARQPILTMASKRMALREETDVRVSYLSQKIGTKYCYFLTQCNAPKARQCLTLPEKKLWNQ